MAAKPTPSERLAEQQALKDAKAAPAEKTREERVREAAKAVIEANRELIQRLAK